ncbi:nucleotide exchange factor GrpE [Actinophytocola sp.]|uniref:nucleotide exchange factor GrpE n=1 Tax=Actinophytocola sp. TaxID=1872138 RepID=UPI003D6B685F
MASWFKRGKDDSGVRGGDSSESTVEVKASVIADAARTAGQQTGGQTGQTRAGIAADGLVTGGDLTADSQPAKEGGPLLDQALAERRSLVQLCLYALDRARSAGVAERLEEGLAGIGVTALRPDGVRFDPAFHEAGGTVATTDETLDGVVAETEVVGFADRGEVLRAPIVTVYSKAAQ